MQTLVNGVHYFHNIGFEQQKELFERLAGGQNPEACFITCADSRIDPLLITNSKPGQLFVIRNAGNIVPCYGTSNNGEMAAIEFAVLGLGVRDIIVCGHTHCGAMKGVLNPESLAEMPSVREWLRHSDSAAAIIKDHYAHLEHDDLVTAIAEENVLVQLEHLRTLPVLASRVPRGIVNLHGWMYKFETGEIFSYRSEQNAFVKLDRAKE
jgi:carbonic anhydrase